MNQKNDTSLPVVLTVAGLDPSGSAGILADARTITALGCYPAAVITAITFQNASGVSDAVVQTPQTVRSQLKPVFEGLSVAGMKTGMLPNPEIVDEVIGFVQRHRVLTLVIDPVMRSTSGYDLIAPNAINALRDDLIPLAAIVTPNIPEAERLLGFAIANEEDMRRAAMMIRETGARSVLIKGGHLDGGTEIVDVLDNGGEVTVFRGERLKGEFRGTGCVLSAAIAACLASGETLEESVGRAREFVLSAMRRAYTVQGRGILLATAQ